jgi:hypothetical protein
MTPDIDSISSKILQSLTFIPIHGWDLSAKLNISHSELYEPLRYLLREGKIEKIVSEEKGGIPFYKKVDVTPTASNPPKSFARRRRTDSAYGKDGKLRLLEPGRIHPVIGERRSECARYEGDGGCLDVFVRRYHGIEGGTCGSGCFEPSKNQNLAEIAASRPGASYG